MATLYTRGSATRTLIAVGIMVARRDLAIARATGMLTHAYVVSAYTRTFHTWQHAHDTHTRAYALGEYTAYAHAMRTTRYRFTHGATCGIVAVSAKSVQS